MSSQVKKISKPKISVVLPVYNGKKYLVEAIDSILGQTYSDFELIIIDDGSTDGSQQILKDFETKDSRIRLITRENRGLVASLNEAIDLADGEWIARMDADDISLPHRFEKQLGWLHRTASDISGSWVRELGNFDKRIFKFRKTDQAIKIELLFSSPFVHPAVMMRTIIAKRLLYDNDCEHAEDYDLWVRAAEAGCRMTNVPEVLLLYRVHSEQVSTRHSNKQLQQGQAIRRRYWEYVFKLMKLNQDLIEENLKIFEVETIEINLDIFDVTMESFLERCSGESRDVIFDNVVRTYMFNSSNCPDIVSRWKKFNLKFGGRNRWDIKLILQIARLIKLQSFAFFIKRIKRQIISRFFFK